MDYSIYLVIKWLLTRKNSINMVEQCTLNHGALTALHIHAPLLVHLNMFLFTWSTFFITAIVAFIVKIRLTGSTVSFRSFFGLCFPPAYIRQKTSRIDLALYAAGKFINPFLDGIAGLFAVAVASFITLFLRYIFPQFAAMDFGYFTIILFCLTVFLVGDFSNYVTHYMQHFVPLLWELHKVHHSATYLNPLTTARQHPLGDLLDLVSSSTLVGLPIGLGMFLYGFDIVDALLLVGCANKIGTILVLDSLRHSQFPVSFGPFDGLLLSPHMHQAHHGSALHHWDKNFGNKLSIWDWLFSTAYKPRRGEEIIFGLSDPRENKDYEGVLGCYIGPLGKIARLVWNRCRSIRIENSSRVFAGLLWRIPKGVDTEGNPARI